MHPGIECGRELMTVRRRYFYVLVLVVAIVVLPLNKGNTVLLL